MRLLALVVLAALVADCDSGPAGAPADPSYSADVQAIFTSSCISCHSGSSPSGSCALTSRAGALGGGTDSVTNVVAGRADSSKLYRKLVGIETPQMPLGQAPLDSVKQQTVRNWIDKGAKDN